MTRGARGRDNLSGVRGRVVLDGPRTRNVYEGGRSRQVLLGPRSRRAGGTFGILSQAELFLDASYSVSGEPRVINQGTGGSALDAKYGSVLGAYVYDGKAVLPGVTGNSLSTPDAAALGITGDIEIVARVSMADWTTGTERAIVGKLTNPGQYSYMAWFNATDRINIRYSPDGTTQISDQATVTTATLGLVDGVTYWFKWTHSTTTGASNFYYAADASGEPSSWTQIGTTVSGTAGAIFAGTDNLYIGSSNGAARMLDGSVYRAIVRDGIDGTTVLDVDLTNVADYATSFTATTGQTVTVNSTTSDTNDPKLLTHTGENYVYVPDVVGDGLGGSQVLPLNIRVTTKFALDGVTTDKAIFGERSGSSGRFWLRVPSSGYVRITRGNGTVLSDCNVPIPQAVMESGVTLEITHDNTVSLPTVRYSTDDGNTWTAAVAGAWSSSPVGSTSVGSFGIGAESPTSTGRPLGGKIYSVKVEDMDSATTVLDVNCATDITNAGATSFTATSGQTVTVNRATSGRKTALVTRPVWLFGTDDFLEVADNALLDFGVGEDITLVAVVRSHATMVSSGSIVSKYGGSGAGWQLRNGSGTPATPGFFCYDGTVLPNAYTGNRTNGALYTIASGRDVALDKLFMSLNGGARADFSDTTTATLANAHPMRVGANPSGTAYHNDMELVAVAVFRRVLTTDEITAINSYYGTA